MRSRQRKRWRWTGTRVSPLNFLHCLHGRRDAYASCADLYGDMNAPAANGLSNGVSHDNYTGPSRVQLSPYDILPGIGKIIDMEFGIATTDQGVSPLNIIILGG